MYCVIEKRDAKEEIMQTVSQVDWLGTRVTYKQRQTCWNSFTKCKIIIWLIAFMWTYTVKEIIGR